MERKNSKFSNVMALIVVIVAFIVLALPGTKWKTVEVTPPPHDSIVVIIDTVSQMSREDTINAMALAFVKQESNFDHKAVSPCGQWVGCLQLSEIMVDEANRILGWDCFNYDDRYDRQGSYAIFRIIQEHKNPKLEIDKAIDLWNPRCGQVYRWAVKKYFEYNLQNYNTLHNYYEI